MTMVITFTVVISIITSIIISVPLLLVRIYQWYMFAVHQNYTEGVSTSSGWAWCHFNMHIFSIFGRLYHINSEIDMHIFSVFSRKYHINRYIFAYAFARGRVYLFISLCSMEDKCCRQSRLLSHVCVVQR